MSRRRSAGRRANLQACWPPPSEGPNARLDEKGGGAVRERSRAHGGAAPGAAPACAVRTERGSSPRRSPSVSGDREKGGRGGGGGTGGRRRQTIPGTPGLKALAGAPPPPGAAAFCASLSGEPPRLKEGGGGRRLPINESQPRGEVSRPPGGGGGRRRRGGGGWGPEGGGGGGGGGTRYPEVLQSPLEPTSIAQPCGSPTACRP
ncbi:unnamed protein product [Prorocentrum cordatum]|uniref:Uncharacterized protein n=1 Tax=Prorocentrum cordatum TaxID=2364126 RepID=A0ABN9U9E8_9DINO|nr:unnamed protein product [Polarella glacialis]